MLTLTFVLEYRLVKVQAECQLWEVPLYIYIYLYIYINFDDAAKIVIAASHTIFLAREPQVWPDCLNLLS